ncbi:hypothetical protein V6N13_024634 [Hibiscus sabdariffa]
MNDASSDSIDENLEETIKDEQQSEPVEIYDKRLDVLKPSIEEPPELELKRAARDDQIGDIESKEKKHGSGDEGDKSEMEA